MTTSGEACADGEAVEYWGMARTKMDGRRHGGHSRYRKRKREREHGVKVLRRHGVAFFCQRDCPYCHGYKVDRRLLSAIEQMREGAEPDPEYDMMTRDWYDADLPGSLVFLAA